MCHSLCKDNPVNEFNCYLVIGGILISLLICCVIFLLVKADGLNEKPSRGAL